MGRSSPFCGSDGSREQRLQAADPQDNQQDSTRFMAKFTLEEIDMADQQDEHIGKTLGRYRLLRRLGGGTFGAVYLAIHLHKDSFAAVKILRTRLTSLRDFKRFVDEARTIRLGHPHIVPVLDFGVSKENIPYLVMEYAAGGTLRQRHPRGSRLDLPTILTYIEQLASALQYAHDQQVIHRDLKPENILVQEDGTLLLSDFGLAKVLEAGSPVSQATFGGTPAYMAPEQSSGNPCFASDQYALAAMLYEWITGDPPALRNLMPDLPSAIEQVVFKALNKEPMERFPSITTFAQAVREAIQTGAEESTLSPPPTSRTPLGNALASDSTSSSSADEASVPAPGSSKEATPPSLPVPLQEQPAQEGKHDPGTLPRRPETVWPKHPLPTVRARVLICLALVLVVGGSLGNWIVAMRAVTTTTTTTALPTRHVAATATATATVLTNRHATPTTTALPTRRAAPTAFVKSGQGWHAQTAGTSQTLSSIGWLGSQFVAVGAGGTILISPNGRIWTPQNSGTSVNLLGVAWSGSQFVVVGAGGWSLTSPNEHTWASQYNFVGDLNSVIWSGSQFITVSAGGGIFTSPDGHTWTPQNFSTSQNLYGVAYSGSQFAVVGAGGTIFTSPDGHTWTPQNSGTSQPLYGVACSGSQCVAVGAGGIILISPNGRSWTPQNSGTFQTLHSVVWSGSHFVVVGAGGTILISPDGRSWTPQNSGTTNELNGVVWSGSQFVAVGAGGTILTLL
ncbi:MAG TPA: protein kinase [Ktedonobacteraceae bacterium]|nr:protein kinase [Ktedonobacteraceae bacterium]